MKKEVILNGKKYFLIREEKEGFLLDKVSERLTDYFDNFDYVFGDWAYGKLRLKGFNRKENKNFKPINDIEKLDTYLHEQCAFGCPCFLIEKSKD